MRVSVITPSLNQARYIARTIESVLSQDHEDLEYVVVDGGSTDGTIEVVERYRDRLAHFVSEPDEGQVDAILKGFALATGEAVAYLNSDDYYLPGAISALVEALEREPRADWSAGGCRYVHADDGTSEVWLTTKPPWSRRAIIRGPWYAPQASSLWRLRAFERVGAFRRDLHYVFDSDFAVRLALAGCVPAIVEREIAVRYLHDAAKSAHPELFADEWERVRRQHLAALQPWDSVTDGLYRVTRRVERAVRRDGGVR